MEKNHRIPVGCVVLAAGNAERFGENKLAAVYRGRTLAQWAMEAVSRDGIDSAFVVTQYDEIEALALRYGFDVIRNDRPELGVSRSVVLGTKALGPISRGILFLVADQPLLKRETVSALTAMFREHPENIVCLSHDGKRGNPCIFPASLFSELTALTGDVGGRAVIARHEDMVLLLEAGAKELYDVDTLYDLEKLSE